MWQNLIDEVGQQHAFMDLFCRGWISDYLAQGKKVFCGRGCDSCCTLAVNATFTEAVMAAREMTVEQEAAVAHHVEKLKKIADEAEDIKSFLRLNRSSVGLCPLISEDGSCGIYKNRPLSCRSLLSTKESRWCAVDFSLLSTTEKERFVSGLDRGAVAFPLHYAAAPQDLGQDLEHASNMRMRETFGFYLYGNFPVLLFLARALLAGQLSMPDLNAVRQCVKDLHLDHPFLVTIEQ